MDNNMIKTTLYSYIDKYSHKQPTQYCKRKTKDNDNDILIKRLQLKLQY